MNRAIYNVPCRMALIDSSMSGIPFEGISDFEVRATISYKGQTAGGIFTFNEQYEMISFTTNNRAVAGTNGRGCVTTLHMRK